MTQHTFRVELERKDSEPIDGGLVTFQGESYDGFGEAEALAAIMPGGGSETLDLSLSGFVRWRGVLMPASEFKRLSVTLVSKGQ